MEGVDSEETLKEEIKKRRYNNSDLLNENVLNKLFSEIKVDTYDELCLGITSLKYTPTQIVNRLIDIFEPKKDDTIEKLLENKNIVKDTPNGKILIAGYGDILTSLANCCNPVLGDEIVGYITKGNGVSIHRKDCKMIDINGERIISAEWNDVVSDKYITNVRIYIDSSNDHLVDIISVATKSDVIVSSINNKGSNKDSDIYDLVCKVKNKENLDKFMNDLNGLNFISKVERL